MELVFIFTVVLFEVLFIDFFEVVKIIRALWIYVFMNDEIFPVFLRDESVAAMRTSKFDGREATFIRREMGVTDFAEKLSFGTIILIKERFRSITTRTAVAVRDIAGRATTDGKNLLTVALFVVRNEIFERPILAEVRNQGKFINLEFLIFWRMGNIESPLLEGNISADKI